MRIKETPKKLTWRSVELMPCGDWERRDGEGSKPPAEGARRGVAGLTLAAVPLLLALGPRQTTEPANM
jgi:hypothetical protein